MQNQYLLTPLASHFTLSKSDCPSTKRESIVMQSLCFDIVVGSLIYIMTCTILDIAHVINILSRFMTNFGKSHCEAKKHVLRYLRGSLDWGILLDGRVESWEDCRFNQIMLVT